MPRPFPVVSDHSFACFHAVAVARGAFPGLLTHVSSWAQFTSVLNAGAWTRHDPTPPNPSALCPSAFIASPLMGVVRAHCTSLHPRAPDLTYYRNCQLRLYLVSKTRLVSLQEPHALAFVQYKWHNMKSKCTQARAVEPSTSRQALSAPFTMAMTTVLLLSLVNLLALQRGPASPLN